MENYYNILKTSGVHLKRDGKPKTSKFSKFMTVMKSHYDRMKYEEKQFNEEIAKINNSKTGISLAPIMNHLSCLNLLLN